jgi:hypothetical protein
MTTWETFRPDPNWLADNTSGNVMSSFDGWHTLVMQVSGGEVSYWIDGRLRETHGGKYYPEVPMSINYNLWFIQNGQINSGEKRQYIEQMDWVYHAANASLSPEEVNAQVAALRVAGTDFVDSVPAQDPALVSPCNF